MASAARAKASTQLREQRRRDKHITSLLWRRVAEKNNISVTLVLLKSRTFVVHIVGSYTNSIEKNATSHVTMPVDIKIYEGVYDSRCTCNSQ